MCYVNMLTKLSLSSLIFDNDLEILSLTQTNIN